MKTHNVLATTCLLLACAGVVTTPSVLAAGNGGGARNVASSVLSDTESEALAFMREEEKLARDAYKTLYQKWQVPVFLNIASSEQQHTDRIKMLLDTYGVADPVLNDQVGVFSNTQLASLYAQLIAQGSVSAVEALRVGALIEETDIADLQKALKDTSRPDISMVYENLMRGSRNHLRAFVSQLASRGITYSSQVLPQTEVDSIVSSSLERGRGNGAGGGRGFGHGGRW